MPNHGFTSRNNPTSFDQTGIPRGSRERYKSRGVVRTTKDTNVPYEDQRISQLGKRNSSIRDLEIQSMLERQLDPRTLSRRVDFTPTSSTTVSMSALVSGIRTAKEYHELQQTHAIDQTEVKKKKDGENRIWSEVPSNNSIPNQQPSNSDACKKAKKDISVLPERSHLANVGQSSSSSKSHQVAASPYLVQGDVTSIPICEIEANKIHPQEAATHPVFLKYSKGESSHKIYIKNLSKEVNELDLVSLFQRFNQQQSKPITYQLLKKGRMKGQAFVTFENPNIASQAIDLLHGYQLKGKPIAISFGAKSSSIT